VVGQPRTTALATGLVAAAYGLSRLVVSRSA
jgi:hypothetical protein